MIKAFIVDDEPSAINTLTLMLKRYVPEVEVIEQSSDPVRALELITLFNPHILFLDIQMPAMNGFELLSRLDKIEFDTIFTTAFDQYAIQAIRFSALDYLLKPIDASDLRASVERFLIKQIQKTEPRPLLDNFLQNIRSTQQNFKLAITTTEGTFFFRSEEIIRLEAESSYCRFYFTNRKPLLASRTLKEFEEILKLHGFIRTHKSHLINTKYIQSVHSEGYAILCDQSRVEISRRRKNDVNEALSRH